MRSTAIQSSTVNTSSDAASRKLLETERERVEKRIAWRLPCASFEMLLI